MSTPHTKTAVKKTSAAAAPSRSNGKPVGFLLQRAHNLLRVQLQDVLEGSGIHLGHVAIMGALATGKSLSQRELSEWTGIEKSSMVIFLDGLEKLEWIRRARHPTDRRAHAVTMTTTGAEKLAILGPRLGDVEARFVAKLPPSERKQLSLLLAKLVS